MNIGVGLLNYCRKDYPFEKLFACKHFTEDNLIIGINEKQFVLEGMNQNNLVKCSGLNVAKSKNLIIRKLKERGFDYIFLFEDDIILQRPEIIDEYIKLLDKTNVSIIFSSYDVNLNRMLPQSNIPADALNIRLKDDVYSFYTNLCGGLIVINLNKFNIIFDESYNHCELKKLAIDAYENKLVPFFTPFIDVQNTQQSFSHKDNATFRKVQHPIIINAFKEENEKINKIIKEKELQPTLDIEKIAKWLING